MSRKAVVATTVAYMEEAGWKDDDVFVVWLNGCTDGWPRAIFKDKEHAEKWVTTIHLNPEGYLIESVNFDDLCAAYTGPWMER